MVRSELDLNQTSKSYGVLKSSWLFYRSVNDRSGSFSNVEPKITYSYLWVFRAIYLWQGIAISTYQSIRSSLSDYSWSGSRSTSHDLLNNMARWQMRVINIADIENALHLNKV